MPVRVGGRVGLDTHEPFGRGLAQRIVGLTILLTGHSGFPRGSRGSARRIDDTIGQAPPKNLRSSETSSPDYLDDPL